MIVVIGVLDTFKLVRLVAFETSSEVSVVSAVTSRLVLVSSLIMRLTSVATLVRPATSAVLHVRAVSAVAEILRAVSPVPLTFNVSSIEQPERISVVTLEHPCKSNAVKDAQF